VINGGEVIVKLLLDNKQFVSGINTSMAQVSALEKGTTQFTNNTTRGLQTTNAAVNNVSKQFTQFANNTSAGFKNSATSALNFSAQMTKTSGTGVAGFGNIVGAIGKVPNALNQAMHSLIGFDLWFGILLGGIFAKFTVGNAMMVEDAKSTFRYVGMQGKEVDKLTKSVTEYAAAASKVDMKEMIDGWKIIRLSVPMTGAQMEKFNGVLGDTIAFFKANGRSAEDAARAVEDSIGGSWKRMIELNIKKGDLIKAGWSGASDDVEGYFMALQKVYQDRGIEGYAKKLDSFADKWQLVREKMILIGIAVGEFLLPILGKAVDGVLGLMEYLGTGWSAAILGVVGLTATFGLLWPAIKLVFSPLTFLVTQLLSLRGASRAAALASGELTIAQTLHAKVTALVSAAQAAYHAALDAGKSKLYAYGAAMYAALGPIGIALIAITALAAAVYLAGNHFGWWTSNIQKAEGALDKINGKVSDLTTRKQAAQQKVDSLTSSMNKYKAGSPEWIKADKELAAAKDDLGKVTGELNSATQDAIDYEYELATAKDMLAEAQKNLSEEYIRYKVLTGEMSEEEAKRRIEEANNAGSLVDSIKEEAGVTGLHAERIKGMNDAMEEGAPVLRDWGTYASETAGAFNRFRDSLNIGDLLEDFNLIMGHGLLKLGVPEWLANPLSGLMGTLSGANAYNFLSDFAEYLFDGAQSGNFFTAPLSDWVVGQIGSLDWTQVIRGAFPNFNFGSIVMDWLFGGPGSGGSGLSGSSSGLGIAGGLDFSWIGLSISQSIMQGLGGFNIDWSRILTAGLPKSINDVISHIRTLPGRIQQGIANIPGIVSGTFNRIPGPAGAAWESVHGRVQGPINRIIGLIGRLQNLVGVSAGSGARAAAGGAAGSPSLGTTIGYSGVPAAGAPLDMSPGSLLEAFKFVPPEWGTAILSQAESVFSTMPDQGLGFDRDPLYIGDKSCCAAGGFSPFDFAAGPGGLLGGLNNVPNVWPQRLIGYANRLAGNYFGVGNFNINDTAGLFKAFISKFFSGFSYQFYYGIQKGIGGTIASRSGNCMDMANVLCAIANAFGYSCSFGRSSVNGIPHVFSSIPGLGNFDPTSFVKGRGWAPMGTSQGSSLGLGVSGRAAGGGDFMGRGPVNITLNITGPIYGEADFIDRMDRIVDEKIVKHIGMDEVTGGW
jgi:hypothetical protein